LAYVAACLFRALFRRAEDAAAVRPARATRWVQRALVTASVANLAFVAGLVALLAGVFGSLEYGIPSALPLLLTIPIVSTGLTILGLAGVGGAWHASEGAFSKALLAIGLLASLAFIPWLACWNLLGYHY